MFDPNCGAYWCDKCGHEMTVDVVRSTEYGLILKCGACDYMRHFVSTTRSSFEEVTDGDIHDSSDCGSSPDDSLLSRSDVDGEGNRAGTGEVQGGGEGSSDLEGRGRGASRKIAGGF